MRAHLDYGIQVIEDIQDLKSIRSEWDALLSQSESDTVFLSWEWLSTWWEAYGYGNQLFVVLLRRDSELVGMAPLYRKVRRSRIGTKVTEYRFLGDGSWDSDYLDFILRKGEEQDGLESIVRFFSLTCKGGDLVFLNEIPETSKTLLWIKDLFQKEGFRFAESTVGCMSLELPASWEDYLKTLRPRMRTKIRSLRRNFEKEMGTADFSLLTDSGELKSRLESLFDLHRRRWMKKFQEGVFVIPHKKEFYEAISSEFIRKGWLRIYSLRAKGDFVAHQFCFRYKDTVFLLQEGYDPLYDEVEAGNLLRALVLEDCIQEGVKIYDFLGGTSFHKSAWGGTEKKSVRLTVGKKSLRSYIYFEGSLARNRAKEKLKKVIPESMLQWRYKTLEKRRQMEFLRKNQGT